MSASILNAQNLSKVVGSAEGKLTILHDLSSTSPAATAWRSSAAPAPASRPCSACSPGSTSPAAARSVSPGTPSATSTRTSGARPRGPCRLRVPVVPVARQPRCAGERDAALELEGRADARQRARELLERVGLGQRLGHYPRQLSGGEQQRVAIARAFAAQPDVLFADEPTGNLDSATGERISDLLFELNRERGTTLVLVTHDERLAHRCRRLIRLESGRLIDRVEP